MTNSDKASDRYAGHLVSLTKPQMRHILELVAWGDQLPTGKTRRVAIRARMLAALQTEPTPVFPEESEGA